MNNVKNFPADRHFSKTYFFVIKNHKMWRYDQNSYKVIENSHRFNTFTYDENLIMIVFLLWWKRWGWTWFFVILWNLHINGCQSKEPPTNRIRQIRWTGGSKLRWGDLHGNHYHALGKWRSIKTPRNSLPEPDQSFEPEKNISIFLLF